MKLMITIGWSSLFSRIGIASRTKARQNFGIKWNVQIHRVGEIWSAFIFLLLSRQFRYPITMAFANGSGWMDRWIDEFTMKHEQWHVKMACWYYFPFFYTTLISLILLQKLFTNNCRRMDSDGAAEL